MVGVHFDEHTSSVFQRGAQLPTSHKSIGVVDRVGHILRGQIGVGIACRGIGGGNPPRQNHRLPPIGNRIASGEVGGVGVADAHGIEPVGGIGPKRCRKDHASLSDRSRDVGEVHRASQIHDTRAGGAGSDWRRRHEDESRTKRGLGADGVGEIIVDGDLRIDSGVRGVDRKRRCRRSTPGEVDLSKDLVGDREIGNNEIVGAVVVDRDCGPTVGGDCA